MPTNISLLGYHVVVVYIYWFYGFRIFCGCLTNRQLRFLLWLERKWSIYVYKSFKYVCCLYVSIAYKTLILIIKSTCPSYWSSVGRGCLCIFYLSDWKFHRDHILENWDWKYVAFFNRQVGTGDVLCEIKPWRWVSALLTFLQGRLDKLVCQSLADLSHQLCQSSLKIFAWFGRQNAVKWILTRIWLCWPVFVNCGFWQCSIIVFKVN